MRTESKIMLIGVGIPSTIFILIITPIFIQFVDLEHEQFQLEKSWVEKLSCDELQDKVLTYKIHQEQKKSRCENK